MLRRVLNTKDTAWREYVERLPKELRDVHYLPEMCVPYEHVKTGQGLLIVDESDDEFAMQPLLRMSDGIYRHAYNFGGPLATEGYAGPLKLSMHLQATLNPFLAVQQSKLLQRPVEYVKDVVWCNLEEPLKLRQTTRHCVKRAVEAGVTVAPVEATTTNIVQFAEMYTYTMDQHCAA